MPIKDWSKYPKNWKTEIRPAILERAGNKCETCKVPNGEYVCRGKWSYKEGDWIDVYQNDDGDIFDASNGNHMGASYVGDIWINAPKSAGCKIVLTISHTDHDIINNDYSNLKALCQRCHNIHDIPFRKANRIKNKGQLQLI